jgi:predicted AAA+ superfamily ATPase
MNRDIINSLIEWKSLKGRKPLILRGARQVGKTYILKEFGAANYRNVAYVNFEEGERLATVFAGDLKPGKILEGLQFYLNREISKQDDLLILDEIQRVPRAITSLKYFAEEMPELSICAAGSLLGVTLNEESFPVGKVTFLDLHPMTFTEFLHGIGFAGLADAMRDYSIGTPLPDMAHEVLWEKWKQYLVVGGLPEAVKCFAENSDDIFRACSKVRVIQKDLLDSYMADIAKHCGKIKAMHIERPSLEYAGMKNWQVPLTGWKKQNLQPGYQ